ncbi:hypothetical protein GAMM_250069 [Gammaproteobacteria bacterium]
MQLGGQISMQIDMIFLQKKRAEGYLHMDWEPSMATRTLQSAKPNAWYGY